MPTSPPQNPVLGSRKGKIWKNPHEKAQQNGTFRVNAVWLKWREKGPKPPPSPFKVALCKLRYKNHHFTLLTPCFWTPIFDLQNKNVDL